MKKKLIEFDVLEKIKNDSLSTAQTELEEAAYYLAKSLNLESLKLDCFGPENVVFESSEGNHVHANYKFDNGYIEFDNVQELIINEESEKTKSKETLSKLLDCLIESKDQEASEAFEEWMNLPSSKRVFTEARKRRLAPVRKNGKPTGKYKVVYWNDTPKKRQSAKVKIARSRGKVLANKKRSASQKRIMASNRRRARATLGEWNTLVENVLGYVNYKEFGPVVELSKVNKDDQGNIVSVKVPTRKLRNEAKMLKFKWNTLDTSMKSKRNDAKNLKNNPDFAKSVEKVKKSNALSNNKDLEESIEELVINFPNVIYLTETELTNQVSKSLEFVGAKNYDDEVCQFISEGLLRTAFETLTDRVAKIVKAAGSKINENSTDQYNNFKNITENYYKELDARNSLEMQVFVDLYEALRNVHEIAKEENNVELAVEVSEYLDTLLPIITNESEPSLEVATEAAEWLYDLVETNMETMDWEVKEPVVSVNGEHPDMLKKAKTSYAPANDFSGHKGKLPAASDGEEVDQENSEKLSNMGFSNHGTYPDIDNPYILKNDEYKIHGEKDIDSDNGRLGHWGSKETWPNLENPYIKHD